MVDQVGRGGMGAVWRARDELLGREVAVKEILLPHGLDDEQLAATRGRALREARAAAQVRHPAVVTIHDVVIEDDHPWIVMDFIRARSLDDRLRQGGALPVAEVARIGEVLLGALSAIHDRGIVHRDVKPANVLLDDDGQVVLTDFGIATIEGDVRFTASGLLVGTPGFMAPERLAGRPVGPPSDLWSLGAVLYAAAEGRPPYEGDTPMVIASAALTRDPAPPRRSGPLGPVITGLLAREPGDRMDARTAAGRLASIARDRAPGEPAQSPPRRPPRDERTRTDPLGAAAGSPAATRRIETSPGDRLGPVPDWLRRPASTPAAGALSSGRTSWRPAWAPSPIGVAAAVVALAVIGLVIWFVAAAPFGGGPVDAVTDPCNLLTDAQAATLAPGIHKTSLPDPHSGECDWSAGQSNATALTVHLASFGKAESAAADLGDRQNHVSAAGVPVAASGIGDEAYARGDPDRQVVVLFRRGRNVVELEYDGDRAQQNALQAARWADAYLGRLGR
jgi:serine/threonine protein kinase